MPTTKRLNKCRCRINQLRNIILRTIYYDDEDYGDVYDYITNRYGNKLRKLTEKLQIVPYGTRNCRRIEKQIRKIQCVAMDNYIDGDITDYLDMLTNEEQKEYKKLANIVFGYY